MGLNRPNKVAVDEQMIPFTGSTCVMKQFVPNKPNPEGIKNLVLAAPNGLVLDFEFYQGKGRRLMDDESLTLGEAAVLRLCHSLNDNTHVFFDRWFTTIRLFDKLREKNLGGTGTIMTNRIPRKDTLELMDDKAMKNSPRGTSSQVIRSDGQVCILKWFDLKPILLASNTVDSNPIETCRRWSKLQKKYVIIPRPRMVGDYNTNMGGIDLVDRMISLYRIRARSNKWTVRTIHHLLDLALANAWILYRQDQIARKAKRCDILQYMDFKMLVARRFLDYCDDSDSEDNIDNGNNNCVLRSGKRKTSTEEPSPPPNKS